MSPISRPEQVLLSQITDLAELVTLRVPVSTVITTEIADYTGSVSCIVVVHGEVELGVDLSKARFEDIDAEARTAMLVLPPPSLLTARLDQERTKVYSVDRYGLWWLTFSDEPGRQVINRAMLQAQSRIEVAGQDPQLHAQARERVERVLRGVFEGIRWEFRLKSSSVPTLARAAGHQALPSGPMPEF